MPYRFYIAIVFAATIVGCGAPDADTLLVFAAASGAAAMSEALEDFEAETSVSIASSAALAQQIEAGAPAAIFLSANPEWVEHLDASGHVAESALVLANSLVLVVPKSSGANIERVNDLAAPALNRIAVADPASVPAGIYAAEALRSLGLWDDVQDKLLPAADVRQALLYVERGEADAGIVYATDARASDKVRVVDSLDHALAEPPVYALALITPHGDNEDARALFRYLQSPEAGKLFKEHGFAPLHPE